MLDIPTPHRQTAGMSDTAWQQCIRADCEATYELDDVLFDCRQCGQLLDVSYDWGRLNIPRAINEFSSRWRGSWTNRDHALDFSGVWRFRELLPFATSGRIVTIGEGRTILQPAAAIAAELGMKPDRLFLQYEGFNPSGSFKDNGMTAALTMANMLGRTRVACASTGNTSASLALFAAHARTASGASMQAVVFIGGGKIAMGKLAQALDYGAMTIQIDGDFDDCLARVRQATERMNLYLVNSVNPFRLEGQKSIMYRVLEGMNWEVPDWIICPGGNLGNSSAFGKAFAELSELGLIDRIPRLAVINAAGANTLHQLVNDQKLTWNGGLWNTAVVHDHWEQMDASNYQAHTIASAIEIGRPVNLPKALRALDIMNGVVREVPDETILDHKALIARHGYGCEPASAASLAGLRLLIDEGIVAPSERVACILTGHQLKDPDATVNYHQSAAPHANQPIKVANDIDAICQAIGSKES
jgi:threonine synthase